jgi:hypothetical protein
MFVIHLAVASDCPSTHAPISWQDEFEMNMRLIGAPTIKDIRRDMVDASSLSSHIGAIPSDKLYDGNCKWKNSCEPNGFFQKCFFF